MCVCVKKKVNEDSQHLQYLGTAVFDSGQKIPFSPSGWMTLIICLDDSQYLFGWFSPSVWNWMILIICLDDRTINWSFQFVISFDLELSFWNKGHFFSHIFSNARRARIRARGWVRNFLQRCLETAKVHNRFPFIRSAKEVQTIVVVCFAKFVDVKGLLLPFSACFLFVHLVSAFAIAFDMQILCKWENRPLRILIIIMGRPRLDAAEV